MRSVPPCFLVTLFATGCVGSGDVTPSEVVVRDSAGIRIVEYAAELTRSPVLLESRWSYGDEANHYPFQYPFTGVITPGGSAVVADAGNREVLHILADGSSHDLWAGTGEGPEEVGRPRSVRAFGDSVWIEDAGNGKLMLYEAGSFLASTSTLAEPSLARSMMPQGVAEDGSLLMVTASYRPDFDQDWLDGHIARYDPASATVDTIGSYPMAPRMPEDRANPFGHGGWATGAGHGVVQTRTDLPEVVWRSADGRVTQIVRWAPTPRYPDAELWERFLAGLSRELARMNPTMGGDRLDEFLAAQKERYAVDENSALPWFGLAVGASDGSVWLPEFVPIGDQPSVYTVIPADGQATGEARFPEPFHVLAVTDEAVLGVAKDAMDVPSVVMHTYRLDG